MRGRRDFGQPAASVRCYLGTGAPGALGAPEPRVRRVSRVHWVCPSHKSTESARCIGCARATGAPGVGARVRRMIGMPGDGSAGNRSANPGAPSHPVHSRPGLPGPGTPGPFGPGSPGPVRAWAHPGPGRAVSICATVDVRSRCDGEKRQTRDCTHSPRAGDRDADTSRTSRSRRHGSGCTDCSACHPTRCEYNVAEPENELRFRHVDDQRRGTALRSGSAL